MSHKRRADKELTKDNWDEEDEPEDKGTFREASADVLKTRVIKTAKRRITNGAAGSEHSSIFSGFTGFGKKIEDKKTPFSFVTNVKGVDTVNTTKDHSKEPAFTFIGGSSSKVDDVVKPSFSFVSNTSSIPVVESVKSTKTQFPIKCNLNTNKTDTAESSSTTNKLTTLSKKLETVVREEETERKQDVESTITDIAQTPDEIFLKKLRSLNLLCAEWIIKHLNENLSYILTPIFDDYKKHLTQLREERRLASSTNKKARIEPAKEKESVGNESTKLQFKQEANWKENFTAAPKPLNFGISSFSSNEKKDTPEVSKSSSTLNTEGTIGFKFFSQEKKNDNLKSFSSTDAKSDTGLFMFNAGSANESKSTNGNAEQAPSSFFSFKSGDKPATNSFFNVNSATKPEEPSENDEDGPPPIEDVTIKEEGSVYDKKCKIFIKKEGNFIDHGVGFLFLKLVDDEKKCQVIVRANNKLANVIINVLLTSSIPVQKLGKNNVMIVCCPTPETKQPTSVLIKVKTPDDAEELLKNLNKYRK